MITINAKSLIEGRIKVIESEIREYEYVMGATNMSHRKIELCAILATLKEMVNYLSLDGKDESEIMEGNYKQWWFAVCNDCTWAGISEGLHGGGQIADTGDYSDVCCPNCGSANIDDI